ncbi:kelch-like protein 1 [Paramacrobiotus metropolitanus]|uniref:kelch-like protein 1 n=1 Tax=Paramacrobiotus metropolitanus TaxID=2943436 RepID=UPI0024463342|nr:kelch-like protein 1 [Paramacrobiotus metropolitanus]
MIERRGCHGVAVLHNRIYAVGGCQINGDDWRELTSMECYDQQRNSWKYVASLPLALEDFAMVASNDRLYVFGGNSPSGVSNKVFCYDPVGDAWSQKGDMLTGRRWCSACIGPSGLIYVVGGDAGKQPEECLRCTEAYDPAADKWLKKADMLRRRNMPGSACAYGKIYVLGGCTEDIRNCDSSIEFYDEVTDTWTLHESRLLTPKSGFGCVTMRMQKGMHLSGLIPVVCEKT